MSKIRPIKNFTLVALIVYLFSLIALLCTLPFFFLQRADIPLGIVLGGIVIGSLYLLGGFAEKNDDSKHRIRFTIISIIVRFVTTAVVSVVISLMYFLWDIPLFNIFSFIAVYLVSIVVTIVVNIIRK